MAMDCLKCAWREKPAAVRQDHCIACSTAFTSSSKVRWGTNELSNKGQTIESYDNHADMEDDRDVVAELHPDYKSARAKSPYRDSFDEAMDISRKTKVPVSEVAFEYVRRFVFELTEMSDHQICLLKDLMRGCKKNEFAERHGLTPTAVNRIYQMMIERSPIVRNFILLTNGTLEGTRGRKRSVSRDGDGGDAIAYGEMRRRKPSKAKDMPVGTIQMFMTFDGQ